MFNSEIPTQGFSSSASVVILKYRADDGSNADIRCLTVLGHIPYATGPVQVSSSSLIQILCWVMRPSTPVSRGGRTTTALTWYHAPRSTMKACPLSEGSLCQAVVFLPSIAFLQG